MQKKIKLTAALLFGMAAGLPVARAQSTVQLYGILDVYAGAQRALGGKTAIGLNSGGMGTSFWGLGGKEDLGGGYAAVFALEAFMRPSTGASGRFSTDTFFGRNAYVGLTGPQGSVLIGRNTLPYFVTSVLFNPFGASFGFSPAMAQLYEGQPGQGVIGDTEWNNSVMYVSPTLGGVTLTGIYGFGNQAGHPGANQLGADLNYARGAFAAALSFQRVKYSLTPGDLEAIIPGFTSQSAYLAATSYDFGPLKLSAQFQRIENSIATGDENSNGGQLGITVPVGTGSVMASFAYTKSKGQTDSIRRTWALGYDYPLSKRTSVYIAYLYDGATAYSSGYNAGVGIQTRF